ncbi:MAG TPA: DUF6152 family protein [Steroidobacteraceae bacterium]|nr:DUF6152 family protein [Steroidobacteraceae bacterium]
MKLRSLLLWSLLAAGGMTASAHHSFAMFDSENQIRLSGKVTEFRWQNPHIYIHLQAPDPKGKMRHWTIECANPGILNRLGWKFNMIKKDDQLTVVVAPLRTGEAGALLKQVKLADGRVFGNGAPAGPPTISIEDGKPLPKAATP